MRLNESRVDTSKLWFHGSSEARVTQLDAPTCLHPFYVTSDLHYAMAFCTKKSSSTGDWDTPKQFTPSDQNYVYVVTLKPDCKVFDFRDKSSPDFKQLYKVIDKEIVEWVENADTKYDHNDIYDFIVGLQLDALAPVENDKSYDAYYERNTNSRGEPLDDDMPIMSEKLFKKIQDFAKENNLQNAYKDLDVHQIMAPILKGLNNLGFQGIVTSEHDYNEEVSQIHTTSAKVTTNYAIGIFDKSGLDIIGLVPMRYKWLKKINPDYWYNSTSETASQKIKRFIQLYKQITKQKTSVSESSLDTAHAWYFGNNRSKNLRIAKPSWNAPFFLTTSYEYAEEYSDYGVYKIELENEKDLNILDFSSKSEVRKLRWPDVLLRKIQTGKNDLNSIAYDMYILAFGTGGQLMYIQDNATWRKAALYFKQKSKGIFSLIRRGASAWGDDDDHAFVLQMWKDIYDAGFDGFTHIEFGKKILALFDFKCMDKISVKPIDKQNALNEGIQSSNLNALINAVLSAYKQKFDIDLSYMKFKVDSQPIYTNGEPCYEYDEDECAGDWTSLSWIRLNPDMKSVMDRYGVSWHGSDDIEEFTKIIIAHELAHEVWNNIADDQFKNEMLAKAGNQNFTTEYLQTVKSSKLDEETFCEYLAHEVVQQDCMQYEPPYTLQQIKEKYPQHIYNKLANDHVHRWRAETGIELIHKEPTEEELDRIWKNWQLMPQKMKDISDRKSLELFGCTNAEHYQRLKKYRNNED